MKQQEKIKCRPENVQILLIHTMSALNIVINDGELSQKPTQMRSVYSY